MGFKLNLQIQDIYDSVFLVTNMFEHIAKKLKRTNFKKLCVGQQLLVSILLQFIEIDNENKQQLIAGVLYSQ